MQITNTRLSSPFLAMLNGSLGFLYAANKFTDSAIYANYREKVSLFSFSLILWLRPIRPLGFQGNHAPIHQHAEEVRHAHRQWRSQPIVEFHRSPLAGFGFIRCAAAIYSERPQNLRVARKQLPHCADDRRFKLPWLSP